MALRLDLARGQVLNDDRCRAVAQASLDHPTAS